MVAVVDIDDASFMKLLRERTPNIVKGRPRSKCDIVFMAARDMRDLERLKEIKGWIEPNGAIWVIRPKGAGAARPRDQRVGARVPPREMDLIEAGLAAGLVDNKIASFSPTHSAMRFVFRLRDRPK